MLVMTVVVLVVVPLLALTRCGTHANSPLPDSSDRVTRSAPLTAEQATTVRQHGRAATKEIIERLGRHGFRPDGEASWEGWDSCMAQSALIGFGQNENGTQHSTDITFDSDGGTVDEALVHNLLHELGIIWSDSDAGRGSRGIYSYRIIRVNALRIGVYSPCYFVRELTDADGGVLPTGDLSEITGFIRQPWEQ